MGTKPIKVWFGTRNFGIAPAGVTTKNTGHHHLLIDAPVPPLDQPIPNDRNHLHFGLGQTETVIELPPGTHTLQLLMGDADHVPHDPPVMSKRITIYVRADRLRRRRRRNRRASSSVEVARDPEAVRQIANRRIVVASRRSA